MQSLLWEWEAQCRQMILGWAIWKRNQVVYLLLLKGLLKGSGREKVSEWLLFVYRCYRHTSGHTRLPSMEGLIISDKIYSSEYELKMHCLCSGPWDLFFIHFLEPSKSTKSTAHIMDSFKLFVWSQCDVLFIRVFLTGQVQIPPHFTPFQTVFFGFAPIEHDPGLCGGLVVLILTKKICSTYWISQGVVNICVLG